MVIEVNPELEERARKVRLLLETMDDYLPGPTTVALAALPGPAASRRVPCEDCRRSGWIKTRRNGAITLVLCLVCEGTGTRRATAREQREAGWDEYTEQPIEEAVVPSTSTGSYDRAANIRRLDASIARIESMLKAHAGELDTQEKFTWEKAREAYERHGSYKELRRALAGLRSAWPEGYAIIRRAYVLTIVTLSPRERELEPLAVIWLAANMRTHRVPPWVLEYDAERRQDAVRELAAHGLSASEIGRRLGIPKKKVGRILGRMSSGSGATISVRGHASSSPVAPVPPAA